MLWSVIPEFWIANGPDMVPPLNDRLLVSTAVMAALRSSYAALTAFAVGGSVVLVLA